MFTSIKASTLTQRFDVRYHLSDKNTDNDSWTLGELKDLIVRDPNCYGFKYARIGLPIIRISDMRQPFIDFSRTVLISENVHQKFHKTHLKPYDILISVRGMSTGKVSIFLGEFDRVNISPNIIIVRLKDAELSPYVAMVLISHVGQNQIKRFFSGGGKPSLTAPMVNAIKIPKPSEDKLKQINLLFKEAKERRTEGKNLLREISQIFEREFTGLNIDKSICSVRNVSDLCDRWDSHYHNDGFVNLRGYLKKYKGEKKLISHYGIEIDEPAKNFDKKEKVQYIEIGSINNLTGIIDSTTINYPELLPKSAKVEVSDGDILISKVRPYLNSNAIVVKSSTTFRTVASKNAFTIFNTEKHHFRYYLVAFLRNKFGLSQIEMYQSGTSYPTVSDDDVNKIFILEIEETSMEQINELYKKYVEIKIIEEFTTNTILEMLQDDEEI
ncbi:restriction endonuclease subunit S [Desulfofustis glycolicus]|uniref:Type I restriction enzyme, S subunit n=1 Tax=Desulfofustis glycolicus DSM 9705 TaxID=1121409 RepID=A0A1M5YDF5_9BACT|nr:restriction endonuclease subunit S [Desulfofustis glycolicus]SHI09939.1 type I restriction enzyme, S subunit [Desulfofustis glycolicus DSM 9705]